MEFVKININELTKLYESGYSLRNLATKYNTSKQTIKSKLTKNNIEIVSSSRWVSEHKDKHKKSSGIKNGPKPKTKPNHVKPTNYKWDTRNNLYDLYIQNKHSILQISKKYGVCEDVIKSRLVKHNIDLRNLKEATKISSNTEHGRSTRSAISKNLWRNQETRNKIISKLKGSHPVMPKDHGLRVSAAMKELYQSEEQLQKHSAMVKKMWKNPTKAMLKHLETLQKNYGFTSNLEKTVHSILDDLNIDYAKKWFDGHEYDIVIKPEQLNRNRGALIEVQGLHWHIDNPRDKVKLNYWKDNLSNDYTLDYIWEHEFGAYNHLFNRVINILGILPNPQNISLNKTIIKKIKNANTLYNKYHYLGGHKYGHTIGLYYDDTIVGAATFSGITRLQSATRLGISTKEIRELSRFCLHPLYKHKNLASWFLSRAIKHLKQHNPKIKKLLTFADQTVGHTGAIYKASNWICDGETSSSYYYELDGMKWHKRTIWRYAKIAGLKENEFVKQFNIKKITTKPKYRFIKNL